GTYDETLIIANADHGGSKRDHGSIYGSNTDIFIGLGGQTIDSGARLHGGNNADIPVLALHGLRMEKPASMTGEVFDESAFLSQEELAKKGRDTDCVSFVCTDQSAELSLSKVKSDVRAADVVIQLGNVQVKDIDVDGGTILRQKEENGELKLTVAFDEQPQVLAKLTFEGAASEDVKVREIMLGTSEGKEVYADLVNTYEAQNSVDISEYQKLQQELKDKQTELDRVRTELTDKTNLLTEKTVELDRAQTTVQSLQGELDTQKSEVTRLGTELQNARESLKQLQQDADVKDTQITGLEERIRELEKLKNTINPAPQVGVQNGDSIEVAHVRYRVTDAEKKEARVDGVSDTGVTAIKIASEVKLGGDTFKVTAVSANAFQNCKKLKSVTIGKNVVSIGKKAFFQCTKLKAVTIKSTKAPKIGRQAFKGIPAKCRITVPKKMTKKQLSSLKAAMKKNGAGSKAVYKKK
ncbi:MAG: leucine-rich repeat protein, partial [Hominisplanchenecus sp.]